MSSNSSCKLLLFATTTLLSYKYCNGSLTSIETSPPDGQHNGNNIIVDGDQHDISNLIDGDGCNLNEPWLCNFENYYSSHTCTLNNVCIFNEFAFLQSGEFKVKMTRHCNNLPFNCNYFHQIKQCRSRYCATNNLCNLEQDTYEVCLIKALLCYDEYCEPDLAQLPFDYRLYDLCCHINDIEEDNHRFQNWVVIVLGVVVIIIFVALYEIYSAFKKYSLKKLCLTVYKKLKYFTKQLIKNYLSVKVMQNNTEYLYNAICKKGKKLKRNIKYHYKNNKMMWCFFNVFDDYFIKIHDTNIAQMIDISYITNLKSPSSVHPSLTNNNNTNNNNNKDVKQKHDDLGISHSNLADDNNNNHNSKINQISHIEPNENNHNHTHNKSNNKNNKKNHKSTKKKRKFKEQHTNKKRKKSKPKYNKSSSKPSKQQTTNKQNHESIEQEQEEQKESEYASHSKPSTSNEDISSFDTQQPEQEEEQQEVIELQEEYDIDDEVMIYDDYDSEYDEEQQGVHEEEKELSEHDTSHISYDCVHEEDEDDEHESHHHDKSIKKNDKIILIACQYCDTMNAEYLSNCDKCKKSLSLEDKPLRPTKPPILRSQSNTEKKSKKKKNKKHKKKKKTAKKETKQVIGYWACVKCTYSNQDKHSQCKMCGATKEESKFSTKCTKKSKKKKSEKIHEAFERQRHHKMHQNHKKMDNKTHHHHNTRKNIPKPPTNSSKTYNKPNNTKMSKMLNPNAKEFIFSKPSKLSTSKSNPHPPPPPLPPPPINNHLQFPSLHTISHSFSNPHSHSPSRRLSKIPRLQKSVNPEPDYAPRHHPNRSYTSPDKMHHAHSSHSHNTHNNNNNTHNLYQLSEHPLPPRFQSPPYHQQPQPTQILSPSEGKPLSSNGDTTSTFASELSSDTTTPLIDPTNTTNTGIDTTTNLINMTLLNPLSALTTAIAPLPSIAPIPTAGIDVNGLPPPPLPPALSTLATVNAVNAATDGVPATSTSDLQRQLSDMEASIQGQLQVLDTLLPGIKPDLSQDIQSMQDNIQEMQTQNNNANLTLDANDNSLPYLDSNNTAVLNQ